MNAPPANQPARAGSVGARRRGSSRTRLLGSARAWIFCGVIFNAFTLAAAAPAPVEPAATEVAPSPAKAEPAKFIVGAVSLESRGLAITVLQAARIKLQLQPGETFDQADIDQAVRALLQTGWFRKVEVKLQPAGNAVYNLVFVLAAQDEARGASPGSRRPNESRNEVPLTANPEADPASGNALRGAPGAGKITIDWTGLDDPVHPAAEIRPPEMLRLDEELRAAQQKVAADQEELRRMREEYAAKLARENAPAAAANPKPSGPAPATTANPPAVVGPRDDLLRRVGDASSQPAPNPSPTPRREIPREVLESADIDQAPVPTYQARPRYPLELRKKGVGGEALVEFIVDADGVVLAARAESATHADFGRAAVEAVSQWRFRPGRKGGQAVATHLRVPIVFTLNSP